MDYFTYPVIQRTPQYDDHPTSVGTENQHEEAHDESCSSQDFPLKDENKTDSKCEEEDCGMSFSLLYTILS